MVDPGNTDPVSVSTRGHAEETVGCLRRAAYPLN